jgi:hypothetical protein
MNPVSLSLDGTCTTPRPLSSPGGVYYVPRGVQPPQTLREGPPGVCMPLIISLGNNREE